MGRKNNSGNNKTTIIEAGNRTKIIQKGNADKTKIIEKPSKKGKKRKSESPEPTQNKSTSFQLSTTGEGESILPPPESSTVNEKDSPVRNESFKSIQSTVNVSPSPPRKNKSSPRKDT